MNVIYNEKEISQKLISIVDNADKLVTNMTRGTVEYNDL